MRTAIVALLLGLGLGCGSGQKPAAHAAEDVLECFLAEREGSAVMTCATDLNTCETLRQAAAADPEVLGVGKGCVKSKVALDVAE